MTLRIFVPARVNPTGWRNAVLKIALILFSLVALLVGDAVHAQLHSLPHRGVELVPIDDPVYSFLRHLSVQGILDGFSEVQLPTSEYEVAHFLEMVDTSKLSRAEQLLRTKYLRTFAHIPADVVTMFPAQNSVPLFFEGIFTQKDKYLYRWEDDSNKSDLFVHGLASLELRDRLTDPSGKVGLLTYGGRFYGTLSGHVGYFLQSTNGSDFGDSLIALEDPVIGKNKNFTFYNRKNFDFTSAELSYNNDWFTAKLAREAVSVGGSYQRDNIILSPNVPYFDFVSIQANVKSVRYQAMVASLLADTLLGGADAQIPPKYLTLHDLTFMIGKDVELGFTDMVIYEGRLDLAYLNPFSFLKSVEHSLNDRDNGLLAMHARWRIVDGVEVQGQGLIDDIVISSIGTGYWSNKVAWQFGGMWAAPFGLKDVDFAAEWTRVEPFTYSHFDRNNTFSNDRTLLGAQIGPNSISYWSELRWQPDEQWTFALSGKLVEHGENIYDAQGNLTYNAGGDYTMTLQGDARGLPYHILGGRQVNTTFIEGTVEFEPWRGLVVFARGTNKSVNYLTGIPKNPSEKPETLIAFGARAMF